MILECTYACTQCGIPQGSRSTRPSPRSTFGASRASCWSTTSPMPIPSCGFRTGWTRWRRIRTPMRSVCPWSATRSTWPPSDRLNTNKRNLMPAPKAYQLVYVDVIHRNQCQGGHQCGAHVPSRHQGHSAERHQVSNQKSAAGRTQGRQGASPIELLLRVIIIL